MKNWILFLLFLLMLLGGLWLYYKYTCPDCFGVATASAAGATTGATAAGAAAGTAAIEEKPKPVQPAPEKVVQNPLVIKDRNNMIAQSPDHFTFPLSDFNPNVPNPTDAALDKLTAYLKDHPDRLSMVRGYYASNEKYDGEFDNLGVARAEDIKQRLVAKGADPDQLKTVGLLRNNLNFKDNLLYGGVDFNFRNKPVDNIAAIPATGDNLKINDGSAFGTEAKANISFKKNEYKVNEPIPAEVRKSYDGMVKYLNKNPKRQLTVTGAYEKSEKNTSLLPTLGLARAANVESKLIGMGAKDGQIEIEDSLYADGSLFKGDQMKGGIQYDFAGRPVADKAATDKRIKDLEKLVIEPKNLYFETAKTQLKLTPELRQYFANVKEYLAKVPSAKVISTGHTDDVGSAAANLKYGQGRAQFVKDQLTSIGVSGKRIQPSSKGETSPIASNKSESGRSKNRRVEIRVVNK